MVKILLSILLFVSFSSLAHAADITLATSIGTNIARAFRTIVFTDKNTGYFFFSDNGNFSYKKSTDGGATWGSSTLIGDSGEILTVMDVWYDQWTPGDNGTKIHVVWGAATSDDVLYDSLDTNGDSLGTRVTIFDGSLHSNARGMFASISKTRSGYLYIAYSVSTTSGNRGLHRSTDGGATWGSNLDSGFIESVDDVSELFPASNTGDNNDLWTIYMDADVDELTLKMWDSSAGSASESSSIQSHTENTTDRTGQHGFSGSIRHSDGHLILAAVSEYDTATGDHKVYDINGTGSITTKTDITTNIDDHYYPSVFIDQNTDDIYVGFNGLRDGSETLGTTTKRYYTKSTDGGSNWTSGSTAYMEGSTDASLQVWTPLSGDLFYMCWRNDTTITGNAVNAVDVSAADGSKLLWWMEYYK